MALADHEIPTVYFNKPTVSGQSVTPTNLVYDLTASGIDDSEADVYIKDVDIGIDSTFVDLLHVDSISYEDATVVEKLLKVAENYENDMVSEHWVLGTNPRVLDAETSLFLYTDPSPGSKGIKTNYRINIGVKDSDRDLPVDITLAEAKYFHIDGSIYCVASGIPYVLKADIQQKNGRIYELSADIYNAGSRKTHMSSDLYSAQLTAINIGTDVEIKEGKRVPIASDIYSVGLKTGLVGGDIKTRSLFVDNFFLGVDKHTEASVKGYVDIVDYVYPIDESKTYIKKDGTTMSGTYMEDIVNGKRLYFDPLDDFYSDGEVVLSLHSESSYGEVLDEDFYLLYGYNIELNEKVFWKPNQRVYVRAQASNKVTCPNIEGVSYYFDTRDYDSYNLAVSINPVGYVDLNASIYPQSTAFFYGQTYTVTVSGVKDYNGNVMAPFTYTFTIESP